MSSEPWLSLGGAGQLQPNPDTAARGPAALRVGDDLDGGLAREGAAAPYAEMERLIGPNPARPPGLRTPVASGLIVGIVMAASPLGFWWLTPATVYALGLTLIAAIYIGFAVADGRWHVIAVESSVAGVFVILAAAAVTGPGWLLVAGLAGHGLKDLWQHRFQYVRGTRWWPPFCVAVDWIAAAILAVAIAAGTDLQL